MKSIKYILSIILLFGAIIVSSAQTYQYQYLWQRTNDSITVTYSTTTITTPHNKSVTVWQWVSGDWSSGTKTDMVSYYQGQYGNRLTLEDAATVKYNCHAWAWAGSTTHWMNSPEEQNYFSSPNQSYTSTVNTAVATKLWYGSADHSANTTSTPSYFISKWGRSPRFRHWVNDSPYSTSSLTYYQGMSSITGSDCVCTSGSSFTVNNPPAKSYTWTQSYNLTPGATSGNFYAANVNISGEGWVAISVDGVEYVKNLFG